MYFSFYHVRNVLFDALKKLRKFSLVLEQWPIFDKDCRNAFLMSLNWTHLCLGRLSIRGALPVKINFFSPFRKYDLVQIIELIFRE